MLFWRLFSIFLNAVFSLDMVLRFLLAYRIPRHSMDMTLSAWETRPLKIAAFYCALPGSIDFGHGGMFWPDLLSVVTGWVSVLEYKQGGFAAEVGRFWRVACFFRTFQLLHLNSITGLLDESWVRYGQSQAIVQVVKFLLVATLACHWAACMWICLEDVVLPEHPREQVAAVSWLSKFLAEHGDPCEPNAKQDAACVYALASYWAMMTVTGVGYGDIVPTNKREYMVCCIFMLCAGFVWAFVVGAVVSLLSAVDTHIVEFRQNSDNLNAFVKEQMVPLPIQRKLRRFILESRHIAYQRAQLECMKACVSAGLQGRVSECNPITNLFRETVFWAHNLPSQALLGAVRALEPACYAASEVIPMTRRMIIIREGVVFAMNKVLTRGSVHGEAQMLLDSDWLADRQFPYTFSHVDILFLTQESLKEVCVQNREAGIRIRRAQIRTAVWRGFIRAAQQLEIAEADAAEKTPSHQERSRIRHRRVSTPSVYGEADDTTFRRSINYLKDPTVTKPLLDPHGTEMTSLENSVLEQVTAQIKAAFASARNDQEAYSQESHVVSERLSRPMSPRVSAGRTRSLTAVSSLVTQNPPST